MTVEYSVCFRWTKVPLNQEQADYCGIMGAFRKLEPAKAAAAMLQDRLGVDWEVWINRHVEYVEGVE